MNRNSVWKYILLFLLLFLSLLYAAPNLFGDDPAVQVSATDRVQIEPETLRKQVETIVIQNKWQARSVMVEHGVVLARFRSTETQIEARDVIKATLGHDYICNNMFYTI